MRNKLSILTSRAPREMELKLSGNLVYHSVFDPKTGSLVRTVDLPEGGSRSWNHRPAWKKEFREMFPRRWDGAFSPVPETVDVSITDRCGFGCSYCYQDSRPRRKHAPKDLVKTIIKGFKLPPYQIAIGGGEPTVHPDFVEILKDASDLGTVPNYTTHGGWTKSKSAGALFEATNRYCGGVAMTYHAFKGIDWFVSHYERLVEAVDVQVNVHLIFDDDVARNLTKLASRLKNIQLVLLAYYADVGRSDFSGMPSKRVYVKDFPEALKKARKAGFSVAFSEGLIPYFLSRPELGVNTQFAMRSEGRFSCYFDPKGRISHSSFSPPFEDEQTVFNTPAQKLWEDRVCSSRNSTPCWDCEFNNRCSTPQDIHYLMCGFLKHNKVPLKERSLKVV